MGRREIGQLLVTVGIAVVVLGVAVAVVQTVIESIKKNNDPELAFDLPDEVWQIILELFKKGAGLAIAAIGLVLIYVGLQMMNEGTKVVIAF